MACFFLLLAAPICSVIVCCMASMRAVPAALLFDWWRTDP